MILPAGVSDKPVELRTKSVKPSSCSSSDTCLLTAGWEIYMNDAAREKLWYIAELMKQLICDSVTMERLLPVGYNAAIQ